MNEYDRNVIYRFLLDYNTICNSHLCVECPLFNTSCMPYSKRNGTSYNPDEIIKAVEGWRVSKNNKTKNQLTH